MASVARGEVSDLDRETSVTAVVRRSSRTARFSFSPVPEPELLSADFFRADEQTTAPVCRPTPCQGSSARTSPRRRCPRVHVSRESHHAASNFSHRHGSTEAERTKRCVPRFDLPRPTALVIGVGSDAFSDIGRLSRLVLMATVLLGGTQARPRALPPARRRRGRSRRGTGPGATSTRRLPGEGREVARVMRLAGVPSQSSAVAREDVNRGCPSRPTGGVPRLGVRCIHRRLPGPLCRRFDDELAGGAGPGDPRCVLSRCPSPP